jgi:YegS/Rv2252/BmrU family lipid kinase
MLIFNPAANLGLARSKVSNLRAIVPDQGIRWINTDYSAHATELAKQAAEESYELVIAVGGDGTVHEVVNGLMQVPQGKRPSLSVIPFGSGNDFANAIGIDEQLPISFERVLNGHPMKVDIGKMHDGNGNTYYWDNTIGIGFDTNVVIRSRRMPVVRGFLIYFLSVFQTMLIDYEAPKILLKTDLEQWEDRLIMLVLCNGGREGGIFRISPNALPHDGVFHYTSVSNVSRLMMLRLLPEFIRGTHVNNPNVRLGKFRKLELTADRPLKIHADGEIVTGFGSDIWKINVEIIPKALEVVIPS